MTSREEIEGLRCRWAQKELARVQNLLLAGRIKDAGLATVQAGGDDYFDLRGLALSQFIKGVEVDHVDFSFLTTTLAGQIGLSTLRHCRFVGADFHSNLGTRFTDCDFTSAKLQRSVLRGAFERCSFASANLSATLANGVRFVECSFAQANLKKANLYSCTFDRCDFTGCKFGGGSLAGSRLIASWPPENDLADTLLERVVFEPSSSSESP